MRCPSTSVVHGCPRQSDDGRGRAERARLCGRDIGLSSERTDDPVAQRSRPGMVVARVGRGDREHSQQARNGRGNACTSMRSRCSASSCSMAIESPNSKRSIATRPSTWPQERRETSKAPDMAAVLLERPDSSACPTGRGRDRRRRGDLRGSRPHVEQRNSQDGPRRVAKQDRVQAGGRRHVSRATDGLARCGSRW